MNDSKSSASQPERRQGQGRGRASKLLVSVAGLFILAALAVSGCGGGGGGGGSEGPTPELPIKVEPFISSLQFPTSLAFTPPGDLLFTELERGVRYYKNGSLQTSSVFFEPVPRTGGEGFLGITLDPDYTSSGFVYVFYTQRDPVQNRVVRFHMQSDGAVDQVSQIVGGLPVGGHNGGRLLIARDRALYVTVGDTGNPSLAQLDDSLAGKLLRFDREGNIPSSNPNPASPIFARGFRNSFGLAEHPETGALYLSDNGPDCNDEINRVERSGNYGWREGQPCDDQEAFDRPIATITPSVGVTGIAFYEGSVFPELEDQLLVGDFNTGSIRRYRVDEQDRGRVIEEGILYPGGVGNILDVDVGPDGFIYFSTTDAIYRIVRG